MNDYVENGIIYENDTKTKIFGSKKDISNILIIPNGVTSIGNGAFNGCKHLTSVIIPDSVKSIGDYAFSNCFSLASITIPASVTQISNTAFYFCYKLTNISIDKNNLGYDSRNDCNAIIETATNTLIIGCKNTIIPDSITSIGDEAFFYCTGLTSIAIPDSIISIGDSAFECCFCLTDIKIPDSVKSIGNHAFEACYSLKNITIPNNVINIGKDIFSDCPDLVRKKGLFKAKVRSFWFKIKTMISRV